METDFYGDHNTNIFMLWPATEGDVTMLRRFGLMR